MRAKSGQNTLEVAIILVVGSVLLVGVISTWGWFNKTLVERLDVYKQYRKTALTTEMGKKVDYTPESLNIFGSIKSIGASPGYDNPFSADDPICSPAYNATMQQVSQAYSDANMLRSEADDFKKQYTEIKGNLGALLVTIAMNPIDQPFADWLYSKYNNIDELLNSNLKDIQEDFDNQLQAYQFSTQPVQYFHKDNDYYDPYDIEPEFIQKGLGFQSNALEKIGQSNQKKHEAEDLSKQAIVDLEVCLGRQKSVGEICVDQCWTDYGQSMRDKYDEADNAYYGGYDVGQNSLSEQLYNEASNLKIQYDTCIGNCE